MTAACERFCNGGDDGADDVPLDYVRLCASFILWRGNGQTERAVAKAIEKYHWTRGWQKELQRREYWYSDDQSPTSEELLKKDQALACEVLRRGAPTIIMDAMWHFVPQERSEEMLHSIQIYWPEYAPPALPAPSTGPEDSENEQGGMSTAKGAQEVGDAGQEAPEGQDGGGADAMEAENSGGADVNAIDVPAGDERTESKYATGREAVEEGVAGDGEDVAGGGGAQGI